MLLPFGDGNVAKGYPALLLDVVQFHGPSSTLGYESLGQYMTLLIGVVTLTAHS